jgi:AcrR family transcriptional regulator
MNDTKGERTRQRIVSTAAPLFNKLGYAGASMADLMAAAGLEKGGLYRHFESKEAIALAAFDHAVHVQRERIRARLDLAPENAAARMVAVAEALAGAASDTVVGGGCPLMNAAVETDDAESPLHSALRTRARRAMTQLLAAVRRIVADGVAAREFAQATDPDAEASALVATMEGALMLAKLYDDPVHLEHAVARVRERAGALAAPRRSRGSTRRATGRPSPAT